jgi:tetratricopeptide (TPR) repeat protein
MSSGRIQRSNPVSGLLPMYASRRPSGEKNGSLPFSVPGNKVACARSSKRTGSRGLELDPNDRAAHSALVNPLRATGRVEEADSHCLRAAENDQQAGSCWSTTLRRQGKADQAIRTLEASQSGHLLEPGVAQALGVAYARAGRREDAERMAAIAPRLASKAQIYAALGDRDRTFELLDQMVPMGPTRLGRDFLNSSNFAFLRGDPRLKELRKKVGLPE